MAAAVTAFTYEKAHDFDRKSKKIEALYGQTQSLEGTMYIEE